MSGALFAAIFSPTGGILSSDDAEKFTRIMQTYGKWPKCRLRLIEILEATESAQLNACSSAGGWDCLFSWLSDAVSNKESDLSKRIMRLLHTTTVTVEQLYKLGSYFNLYMLSKKVNAPQDEHPYEFTSKHDVNDNQKIISEDVSACLQADINKSKELLTIPNHPSIPDGFDCEEGHQAEEENPTVMEYKDINEFMRSIQLPSIKHLGRIPKKKVRPTSDLTQNSPVTTSKETTSEERITFLDDDSHKRVTEDIPSEDVSACLQADINKPKELLTIPNHPSIPEGFDCKKRHQAEKENPTDDDSHKRVTEDIPSEDVSACLQADINKPKELLTIPNHPSIPEGFDCKKRHQAEKENPTDDDSHKRVTEDIPSEDVSACLQADINKPKELLTIPNHPSIPEGFDCKKRHQAEKENPTVMGFKDINEFMRSIQLPSIKHLGRIPKKKVLPPSVTCNSLVTTSKQTTSEERITFLHDDSHKRVSEDIPFENLPGNKRKPKELVTTPVHIPLDGSDNIVIKIGPWPEPKGYDPEMSKRHLAEEIYYKNVKRPRTDWRIYSVNFD